MTTSTENIIGRLHLSILGVLPFDISVIFKANKDDITVLGVSSQPPEQVHVFGTELRIAP